MRFAEELEKVIRDAIASHMYDMSLGMMDPKTYDRTAGGILAFRTVVESWMPEIAKKLNEQ